MEITKEIDNYCIEIIELISDDVDFDEFLGMWDSRDIYELYKSKYLSKNNEG
jgi:hypothetical protein